MISPFTRRMIKLAIEEDIGLGDITSELILPEGLEGTAVAIAKQDGILAGSKAFKIVYEEIDYHLGTKVHIDFHKTDGDHLFAGDKIVTLKGSVLAIMMGERVALNFLQRLSGIASLTAKFVQQVKGLPVKIVDTRKTTPGWRELEKYAVTVGGGYNHRFGLYDSVLIKDNHITAAGSITAAVKSVREKIPHTMKIEVETESLADVEEALRSHVDIIMLDNMPVNMVRQAVKMINKRAIIEVSGGVNLKNIREFAETGIDVISIGALTHSVESIDISLKLKVN